MRWSWPTAKRAPASPGHARARTALVCLLALTAFGLAIWTIVPAPTRALLPLGVGAPELAPQLLVLALLVLAAALRWTRGLARTCALVLAGLAALCTLRPLVVLPWTHGRAETALEAAMGGLYRPPASRTMLDVVRWTPAAATTDDHDVPYPGADGAPRTMEIYRPDIASTRADASLPVVVQIYGGAWQRGTPRDYAWFARAIAAEGYVVFSIDYRHAPAHRYPAQLDDVRAALRWIGQNAARYGADMSRTVLLGRSAGAHLAMLAAWAPGTLPLTLPLPTETAPRIRGVVSLYGPVDLVDGYRNPPSPDPLDVRRVEEAFLGGTPSSMLATYQAASPITHVRRDLPPTLLLYGARDHIVEARYGRQLRDALRGQGNSVVHVELPWAEHAFDAVPNGLGGRLSRSLITRWLAWATAL